MPLEIFGFHPEQPAHAQWRRIYTVYPGEEIQIPNVNTEGKFELMRVQVKPDDSLSTVHTIFPEEVIIRSKESELPSQVSFDPSKSKNLPQVILKGECIDVFSRAVLIRPDGLRVEEISRGRLCQR